MTVHEPIHVWRMAGGDGTRRGVSGAELPERLRLTRTLPARGAVTASPVFSKDGIVYIADRAGFVQAFSSNGVLLWREEIGAGVEASPALDGGDAILAVGAVNGTITFFDARTGNRLSRAFYDYHDPRILADLLHVEGEDYFVTSLWGRWSSIAQSASRGEPDFTWDAGWYPRSGMAVSVERGLYGVRVESGKTSKGTRLFHIDPATGADRSVLFSDAGDEDARRLGCFASPAIAGGAVYAVVNSACRCKVFPVELDTEKTRPPMELDCCVYATPALPLDGSVILAGMDGRVHAFGSGGASRYVYDTGSDYLLSGAVCDRAGTVVVGDPEGRVHRIGADGEGGIAFEAGRAIDGRPAFDPSGRLFVPCGDGNVHVLE